MPNRNKRPTPPPKLSLTPDEFARLVDDHGVFVKVTPSVVCPRRSGRRVELTDTNHDLNCPLCQGVLAIDLDSKAFDTWAFIQGIEIEKIIESNGIFDVKDCMASFQPGVRPHYWYKIEVLDFAAQFNEVVQRGTGDVDRLRYPPVDFEDDGNIFACVDGSETLKEFVKDTDYSVNGNELTWLTANKPDSGRLYSLLYPVLPTFRVLELPHETRHYYNTKRKAEKEPVQMPVQAHIRWDFMARGQGSDIPQS